MAADHRTDDADDEREHLWAGFRRGLDDAEAGELRAAYDRLVDQAGLGPYPALTRVAKLRRARADARARASGGQQHYLAGFLRGLDVTAEQRRRIREAFRRGWDEQGPDRGLRYARARARHPRPLKFGHEQSRPRRAGGDLVNRSRKPDRARARPPAARLSRWTTCGWWT